MNTIPMEYKKTATPKQLATIDWLVILGDEIDDVTEVYITLSQIPEQTVMIIMTNMRIPISLCRGAKDSLVSGETLKMNFYFPSIFHMENEII